MSVHSAGSRTWKYIRRRGSFENAYRSWCVCCRKRKNSPSQRRCGERAVSVTSNIAEGHGRYNWQDNTRFCRVARGSVLELIDQINVCIDESYFDAKHLEQLKQEDALTLLKLLNGYIKYLQKQKSKLNY